MPRYFFHTEDGESRHDNEGLELPDDACARVEGARLLGQMLKDYAAGFWDHQALTLTVTDAADLMLFALEISAVEASAFRPRPAWP